MVERIKWVPAGPSHRDMRPQILDIGKPKEQKSKKSKSKIKRDMADRINKRIGRMDKKGLAMRGGQR